MEKATRGQFCEFIGKLLVKVKDEKVTEIDKIKIQEAIDSLSSEEATVLDKFISFINNGCQPTTVLVNSFIVGDIFCHRAEKGDHRLYLSDNTQNWLIKPNLKKVISIRTDLGKLSEYFLPKNMNDSSIQSNTGNPGLMELETFFCVMYLLIFQPELGKRALRFSLQKDKWYIFHVMVNGKKVAFSVRWDVGEWFFSAGGFDHGDDWREGYVFVSLAIA